MLMACGFARVFLFGFGFLLVWVVVIDFPFACYCLFGFACTVRFWVSA